MKQPIIYVREGPPPEGYEPVPGTPCVYRLKSGAGGKAGENGDRNNETMFRCQHFCLKPIQRACCGWINRFYCMRDGIFTTAQACADCQDAQADPKPPISQPQTERKVDHADIHP